MGETPPSRPDSPVWCPTSSGPRETGQSKPNARVPGSFDARVLLGMKEAAATAKVRASGCLIRVIARDGRYFAITADFRTNRVNVAIEGGLVTSIGVY